MSNAEFITLLAKTRGPLVPEKRHSFVTFCMVSPTCSVCPINKECHQYFPSSAPRLSLEEFQLFSTEYPEYFI